MLNQIQWNKSSFVLIFFSGTTFVQNICKQQPSIKTWQQKMVKYMMLNLCMDIIDLLFALKNVEHREIVVSLVTPNSIRQKKFDLIKNG